MTDTYALTDWHFVNGVAEITVTKGNRSHRVSVKMASTKDGKEPWDEGTRAAAIRAFKERETDRICKAASAQYQPGCAKGAGP